jgi:hypothetical protein
MTKVRQATKKFKSRVRTNIFAVTDHWNLALGTTRGAMAIDKRTVDGTAELHDAVPDAFYTVRPGEEAKNLDSLYQRWTRLNRLASRS